jgi:hypothetical protein
MKAPSTTYGGPIKKYAPTTPSKVGAFSFIMFLNYKVQKKFVLWFQK